MKENVMNEIMEMYSEITKVTTICMDYLHMIPPLFTSGLDISVLLEYTDFEEIISFLINKFEHAADKTSLKPNTFHTFHTKNLFVYNIIFTSNDVGIYIALIAGPILTFLPSKKSLNEKLINNGLPLNKKFEFMGILNVLPLASNERISQLGKLLLALNKSHAQNWNSSLQEFHGRKSTEEALYLKHLKETMSPEYVYNELHDMYKFCGKLMDNILHGNVNGIIDLIGEYSYFFWHMETINDNNRALKNRSIIICSISCHFAIQANVPYDRMFHYLWKFVLKLEELNSTDDIIRHLQATIEGFTHAVFSLSDNSYSLHINRVLQYIKSHYTEKITLNQLSKHINVNPVYLSSLIKKETNLSLSNHINLIRIEESKKLLIFTIKPMHEIALDVGYNYQNHFNTVFKKLEGMTPLEYRNINGKMNDVLFT